MGHLALASSFFLNSPLGLFSSSGTPVHPLIDCIIPSICPGISFNPKISPSGPSPVVQSPGGFPLFNSLENDHQQPTGLSAPLNLCDFICPVALSSLLLFLLINFLPLWVFASQVQWTGDIGEEQQEKLANLTHDQNQKNDQPSPQQSMEMEGMGEEEQASPPAAAAEVPPQPHLLNDEPAHYRLERYLMANYNNRLIPRKKSHKVIQVLLTIGLYQIIEVQYILLNSWIVERWKDELLYWDIDQFEGIREIVLPRESVWIPDTTLYNSLVMDDAESRRILNVKVNTLPDDGAALVEMLYPTLYQFSCMLDLRFFPFDIQHCIMTFGSWTHDNKNIDYFAYDDSADKIVPTLVGNGSLGPTRGGIGIEHCLPNEGWISRREVKFHCCENNYTLLEFKLHIQRKPLFYLVNLICPTSIITLIAIVGFFSSSTVNDIREEKISLGITTLLSMSILIFMVSDQMPSTSSFIPLIGWFYTSMMGLISGGTLAASFVIYVQKKGIIGQRPSRNTMRWARLLGRLILMEMPLLMKQAYALKAKQDKLQKQRQQWEQQQQQKRQQQQSFSAGTPPRRPTWFQQKWQAAKAANNNQQQQQGGLGPLISRYRSNEMQQQNGNAQTGTSILGPSLGNAMAFLIPNARRAQAPSSRSSSPPPRQKVSTTDSMNVSFLEAPARMHNYQSSINEEDSEDEENRSQTSRSTGRETGEEPKSPVTREGSESLNLIDMDEETLREEGEGGGGGEQANHHRQQSSTEGGGGGGGRRRGGGEGLQKPPNHQKGQMEEGEGEEDDAGNGRRRKLLEPMDLTNPLVANAAALSPMTKFAQSMIQRVQQRERERILSEVERRRQQATHKPSMSMFHRSNSSMADLYAASLFPPTPSETAMGGLQDLNTAATLTEASSKLAALHPQVQRNLAEIEFDWLAAVLERMFLILFSFLFFLLSFGINGIGVYYWYFTYIDMVENS